jgi:hypothetical protein
VLKVALYKWGYISEDGEYEELGDGRMVFTANVDEALLSGQELQGDEGEASGLEEGGSSVAGLPAGAGAAAAAEMGWCVLGGGQVGVRGAQLQLGGAGARVAHL